MPFEIHNNYSTFFKQLSHSKTAVALGFKRTKIKSTKVSSTPHKKCSSFFFLPFVFLLPHVADGRHCADNLICTHFQSCPTKLSDQVTVKVNGLHCEPSHLVERANHIPLLSYLTR